MYDADTDIDEYGDADRHRDSGANPFRDEHEHKYADEYAYLYGDEYGNGDIHINKHFDTDVHADSCYVSDADCDRNTSGDGCVAGDDRFAGCTYYGAYYGQRYDGPRHYFVRPEHRL